MRMPLLLLHGFPLGARMWRPLVERFQHERVVVTPDASELLPRPLDNPTVGQMADGAIRALDAVQADAPAVVAGLSMGGYVALEIARRHPDRIAALVLADTRATADAAETRAARNAMIEAVRAHGVPEGTKSLREKMLAPGASPQVRALVDELIAGRDPDIVVACIEAMRDRADSTDVLKALRAPVLVVRGAEDALVSREEAETTAAMARDARLVTIRRSGHIPPLEYPLGFNAAFIDFLREIAE